MKTTQNERIIIKREELNYKQSWKDGESDETFYTPLFPV
jgi:hypothetical protein